MSSLWDAVFIQVLDCTGPLMLNLMEHPISAWTTFYADLYQTVVRSASGPPIHQIRGINKTFVEAVRIFMPRFRERTIAILQQLVIIRRKSMAVVGLLQPPAPAPSFDYVDVDAILAVVASEAHSMERFWMYAARQITRLP
jgi:hypothetical protein